MKTSFFYVVCALLLLLSACRKENIIPQVPSQVTPSESTSCLGFYLLNQGAWGTNKASLDYYDFATGSYQRNVYESKNPELPLGLGDVGNDLQIHGGKLYAAINGSNKIVVIEAATTRRITEIEIPNARYFCFAGDKVYVSAYVATTPGAKGAVYEIDTTSLTITRRCEVGLQPEMLEVVDNTLYVANSGGYNPPAYDNTVSVVPLTSFIPETPIEVGINLEELRVDQYQQIWVTSRGNYADRPANLFCLAKDEHSQKYQVVKDLQLPCSRFDLRGDSLFYYYSLTNYSTKTTVNTFGVLDVKKREVLTTHFLNNMELRTPFNIVVHPNSGNLYIADATDFQSSGFLYCFAFDGTYKWKVQTGDIPAAIAFILR